MCSLCFAEKHKQVLPMLSHRSESTLPMPQSQQPPCISCIEICYFEPNFVANAQYWVLFLLVSKAWAQFPVLTVFHGPWGVHLGCGPLSCWEWKVSSSGRQNPLSMQHLSNCGPLSPFCFSFQHQKVSSVLTLIAFFNNRSCFIQICVKLKK